MYPDYNCSFEILHSRLQILCWVGVDVDTVTVVNTVIAVEVHVIEVMCFVRKSTCSLY